MMDIVEELSLAILDWTSQGATRTMGNLQRRSNVSESTLRRIKDREQKSVQMDIAMELAYVLFDTDEAIVFLTKYFPVSGKWQEKVYSKKDDVVTLAPFYRDTTTYKIILLCDTESGASIEDIKEDLGSTGVRELSRLVELGIIAESNGQHTFYPKELALVASTSTHFAMLQNFMTYYVTENANTPGACAEFVYSKGLKPEIIRTLSRKIREFEAYIVETISDEKNKGDIPWFIGLIQNILKGKIL